MKYHDSDGNLMNYHYKGSDSKALYLQPNIVKDIKENLPNNELKHLDKYYYPVHAINHGYVLDKRITSDGFVPLNTSVIRDVLTWRHDKKIVDYLKENEIIECNNTFGEGFSRGYKISEKYKLQPVKRIHSKDRKLNKKLNLNVELKDPVLKQMYKNLKLINIDYSSAEQFLNEELFGSINSTIYPTLQHLQQTNITTLTPYFATLFDNNQYVSNLWLEKSDIKLIKNAIHRYNSGFISINFISNNDFFIVRDNTGNRVHTNATNLRKDLWKFINVRDYNLVNIDIANSQPFILNTLITNLEGIDVEFYRQLTTEGKLWKYLMDLSCYNDKSRFKKIMFEQVFYGKPGRKRLSKPAKIFKETFPTIFRYIEELKKDNYKELSIEMQRREADIIIDTVCRKLTRERIFFLTIHDSIIVDEPYYEYVCDLIKNAFQNKYNITPTLRKEYLKDK